MGWCILAPTMATAPPISCTRLTRALAPNCGVLPEGWGLNFSSPTIVEGVVNIRRAGANGGIDAYGLGPEADLFLRVQPSTTTAHQGDLITYAFPVWDLGPGNAVHEVLNTQVPEGTTFDYIRISGTPGLGTCTTPPYEGTGEIVCHANSAMAPNTTRTAR